MHDVQFLKGLCVHDLASGHHSRHYINMSLMASRNVVQGKAQEWNDVTHAATEIPFAFVKKQLAGKRHQPSYVTSPLERSSGNQKQESPDEEAIEWTAATLCGAGADTTSGTFSFFVLAMVDFPDAQRKAQEELSRVIGPRRLPRFGD